MKHNLNDKNYIIVNEFLQLENKSTKFKLIEDSKILQNHDPNISDNLLKFIQQ